MLAMMAALCTGARFWLALLAMVGYLNASPKKSQRMKQMLQLWTNWNITGTLGVLVTWKPGSIIRYLANHEVSRYIANHQTCQMIVEGMLKKGRLILQMCQIIREGMCILPMILWKVFKAMIHVLLMKIILRSAIMLDLSLSATMLDLSLSTPIIIANGGKNWMGYAITLIMINWSKLVLSKKSWMGYMISRTIENWYIWCTTLLSAWTSLMLYTEPSPDWWSTEETISGNDWVEGLGRGLSEDNARKRAKRL